MRRATLLLFLFLLIYKVSLATTYYNRTGTTYCNNLANWTTSATGAVRPFTIGGGSPAPLPVELVEFSGTTQNGINILDWFTASELNNDRFVIERSVDGRTFKPIGEVKGCGTCNIPSGYTFSDESDHPSNYYRLRQVDFDGTAIYSEIVHLVNKGASTRVFPNPCVERVSVYGSGIDRIFVYGSRGETVRDVNCKGMDGDSGFNVELSDLPAGVYMMKVYSDGALVMSEKLLKLE